VKRKMAIETLRRWKQFAGGVEALKASKTSTLVKTLRKKGYVYQRQRDGTMKWVKRYG
jgi:hypothetical protein